MALYRYRNKAPQLPASAYVAAEATLIGDVTLGEGASLWPVSYTHLTLPTNREV